MSRGFRFMLSVCLFLLGGFNSVFAVSQHIKTSDAPSRVEKIQSPRIGDGNLTNPAVEINRFNEKKNDFLSIEDDDEEITFARKYIILERDIIAVPYIALTNYPNKNYTIRLPFCRHLSYTSSYIYLLQGVLRL